MSPTTFDDASYRFSPISPHDHAGYVWIATILGLIYSGLSGLARARIKWGVHGAEDYLLGLATIVFLGQSAAVIYGLQRGLAKSNAITLEADWTLTGQSFFASEILSILTLCLAKCSIIALIFRVFTIEIDRAWLLSLGTLILTVIWGVGSIVAVTVNCDAHTILTVKEVTTCPSQFTRWQAITAVDIVTEICICALPLAFVWPTNMSRSIKFQVFVAFAFRLPLVGLSGVHLFLLKNYPQSSQPQFTIAGSLILRQVMLTYSLISATIPNFKSFMKSFSMGMGVSIGFIRNDLNNSSNAYPDPSFVSHTGSVGLRSKRRNGNDVTSTTVAGSRIEDEGFELRPIFRPDQVQHEVTVKGRSDILSRTPDSERLPSQNGSQDMIIKKEVGWNVYHERMDVSSKQGLECARS